MNLSVSSAQLLSYFQLIIFVNFAIYFFHGV